MSVCDDTITGVTAIPTVVRRKAMVAGANRWLDELPALISELERRWNVVVGRPYGDPTEAYVAEATRADGTEAVVKLMVPPEGNHVRHEITVLRLANGHGCVRLLDSADEHGAMLLERLGPSMFDLEIPIDRRHRLLCAAAQQMWRPADGAELPTGADKGRWLITHIESAWEDSDRPCSEKAVAQALECLERRIAAHAAERAVLVHGDVHQWNALWSGTEFVLIDPDGLEAEPEYDLGVMMREDPVELMEGDPADRARQLAQWTGLDARAIWEWGVAERVSTGLLATRIGLQPVGRQMLAAADQIAEQNPSVSR